MLKIVVLLSACMVAVAGLCVMFLMLLAGDPADYIQTHYTQETLKRKERHDRLMGYACICIWIAFGAGLVLIPSMQLASK